MNKPIYLKSNIASNNSLNGNNLYLLDLSLHIPITQCEWNYVFCVLMTNSEMFSNVYVLDVKVSLTTVCWETVS